MTITVQNHSFDTGFPNLNSALIDILETEIRNPKTGRLDNAVMESVAHSIFNALSNANSKDLQIVAAFEKEFGFDVKDLRKFEALVLTGEFSDYFKIECGEEAFQKTLRQTAQ